MSVRAQVMRAIDANPDLPHSVLARKVAIDIGEPALIALATQRIERMIAAERRKRVREIEDDSTDLGERADGAEWAVVDALLDEFRQAIIVDWTAELLGAEFALGDGRTVTWGKATPEQHVARIHLLAQNVRGNLVAIRRHEAALAAIAARGATCLELAVLDAAA